jgi:ADP-ribose pyrophosphatase
MALVAAHRVYTGRVVNLDVDTVRYPDGSESELEMVRHPGAAAVVPFLDDPSHPDPRVVLIRQFRHAADGFIWEIPAGRLDPGESPEHCARRELAEEAGFEAGQLQWLTTIYTTPGFTDEQIHMFAGSELKEVRTRPEADEFVEVHPLAWSSVMEMVRRGDIRDCKTLVALLFVDRFTR